VNDTPEKPLATSGLIGTLWKARTDIWLGHNPTKPRVANYGIADPHDYHVPRGDYILIVNVVASAHRLRQKFPPLDKLFDWDFLTEKELIRVSAFTIREWSDLFWPATRK